MVQSSSYGSALLSHSATQPYEAGRRSTILAFVCHPGARFRAPALSTRLQTPKDLRVQAIFSSRLRDWRSKKKVKTVVSGFRVLVDFLLSLELSSFARDTSTQCCDYSDVGQRQHQTEAPCRFTMPALNQSKDGLSAFLSGLGRHPKCSLPKLLTLTRRYAVDLIPTWKNLDEVQQSVDDAWTAYEGSDQNRLPELARSCVEVQFLLEYSRRIHSDTSRALSSAVSYNEKVREERRKKQVDTTIQPLKLNFDREDGKEGGVPSRDLLRQQVSLEDERKLLLPAVTAVKVLEKAFPDGVRSDQFEKEDYVQAIEEMMPIATYLAGYLRLHRMAYSALVSARTAWNMVRGHPGLPAGLSLTAATCYMSCLMDAQLYDRCVDVIQFVTLNVDKGERGRHLLENSAFMTQAAWIMMFTHQMTHLVNALNVLKSMCEHDEVKPADRSVLRGMYLRLLANLTVARHLVSDEDLATLSTPAILSPIFLLEDSHEHLSGVFTQPVTDSFLRWHRRVEYLSVIEDLIKFYLFLGSPAEALVYCNLAVKLAQRDFSCRWALRFMSYQAQCCHSDLSSATNQTRFGGIVTDMEKLLMRRNESLLFVLDRAGGATLGKESCAGNFAFALTPEWIEPVEDKVDSERPKLPPAMCVPPVIQEEIHPETCVCEEHCLDYDVHVALMETAFLHYIAVPELSGRSAVLKKANEMYAKLSKKRSGLRRLLKKDPSSAGNEEQIVSPVEAGFFRIRLLHVAGNLQVMKPSSSFEQTKSALKKYPDFEVRHPDIIALCQQLEILTMLYEEASSTSRLQKMSKPEIEELGEWRRQEVIRSRLREIINAQWVVPSNNVAAANQHDLTTTFWKFSIGTASPGRPGLALSSFTSRPATPERSDPHARTKGIPKAPDAPRASSKTIRKIRDNGEPELPPDLAAEASKQTKAINEKRRQTMLPTAHFCPEGDNMTARVSHVLASKISDKLGNVIELLQLQMDRLAAFPLYPYYAMSSSLHTLLSGVGESPEKLARWSSAGTGGKLTYMLDVNRERSLKRARVEGALDPDLTKFSFGTGLEDLDTSKLPEDWVVCSISFVTRATLPLFGSPSPRILHVISTRWEKGAQPITMAVPVVDREAAQAIENLVMWLKESSVNQTSYTNTREYWKTRMRINYDLSCLTEAMEVLLGPAKVLLLAGPSLPSEKTELAKELRTVKSNATKKGININVPASVLRLSAIAGVFLDSHLLVRFLSLLLRRAEDSSEVVYLAQAVRSKPFANPCYPQSPVILILDNAAYGLPWESIPTKRTQPVSRLPSVHCVNLYLTRFQEDLKRVHGYYILNPTAEFKKTQDSFEGFFQKKGLATWEGISGKPPLVDQVHHAAKNRDMLLYMGHGSGQEYFKFDLRNPISIKSAMFLVGCSSAKLQHGPSMDASGFIHHCIVMGRMGRGLPGPSASFWLKSQGLMRTRTTKAVVLPCPCVLGNLWEVTSGCIDTFTVSVLEELFSEAESKKPSRSFLGLIALSRDSIERFSYLVGAAPVVIGLPLMY